MATFEKKLAATPVPSAVDRLWAGWLLLVGRKADQISATPEPADWRKVLDGDIRPLQLFDWMSWWASFHGWEEAVLLVTDFLRHQPLGASGLWRHRQEMKEWLEREWDTPPPLLVSFLADPAWEEAARRGRAARWLGEPTYNRMTRLAAGRGRLPNFQNGAACAVLHRAWSTPDGRSCCYSSPHLMVRENGKEAMVHLGALCAAGSTTNGAPFLGTDAEGNEVSGIDTSREGIPHRRLMEVVKAAVAFWDGLN